MNSYLEEELAAGMREEAAGARLGTGVLEAAKRQHHRHVVRRRGAYAIGVAGVAGAVAAVLAVGVPGARGGTGGTGRPPAASAESPKLSLVAAITASEKMSYHVKVTERWGPDSLQTTAGAFDPATATGYLDSKWSGAPVVYKERLVGGARFSSSSGSKGWKPEPGHFDRLNYDRNLSGAASASASPDRLFALLRTSGAEISRTGSAGYHFTMTLTPNDGITTKDTYVGDIALDADYRISKITYRRAQAVSKRGVPAGTTTTDVTVAFSAYGELVTVERPAK
jgi:hypothetical protein